MNWTDEQRQAIETPARVTCVDAGAGSGKTSVLVNRILHLVGEEMASLDQIVAITFMDAAASEMKTRLRAEFRKRAPVTDPAEMTRWRDMERRLEYARISSIHSFCAGLLRDNALRIGLDPEFTVLADAEDLLMRHEVITETLHAMLDNSHPGAVRIAAEIGVKKLTEELNYLLGQSRLMRQVAREYPLDDPVQWTAKVKVLTEAFYMRKKQALADSGRLRSYKEQLQQFEGKCRNPKDGREMARGIMIEGLEQLESTNDFDTVHDILNRLAAVKFQGTRPQNWDDVRTCERLANTQKAVRDMAEQCVPPAWDDAVERRAATLACDLFSVYQEIERAFSNAKTEQNSLNFDDLIFKALDMLQKHPDIRARTAAGIKYLLIDEFQDTDSIQLAIARLLADAPGGPSLFVVGDAKQSIYDFRGAEVEVFREERLRADAVIPLDENFRTVPEILEFINDLFQSNGALRAVEPRYLSLKARRQPADAVRVEFLLPPDASGSKRDGRALEADLIASRIREFMADPAPCIWDTRQQCDRPARYDDMAILFRAFSDLYIYEEALRNAEIPFTVVGGAGFYERQEVLDLRNLLTLLVDPLDEVALLAVLRGPFAGLSDDAVLRLCMEGGLTAAFYGGVSDKEPVMAGRLESFRRLLDEFRVHAVLPLQEFLRYVMERTGYESILLSQFLGAQRAQNVRRLIALAGDFSRTRPPGLAEFAHYLEMVSGQEVRENDAAVQTTETGSVLLMTIHKAKGLEFPIVFVPDISRQTNKSISDWSLVHRELGAAVRLTGADGQPVSPALHKTIKDAKSLKGREESARLLYVAMTRARDWLILSGAPENTKESWMPWFQERHKVLDLDDGRIVRGPNWSFRVRRRIGGIQPARISAPAEKPVHWDQLAAYAAPLESAAVSRRVFSVSEVLNCVFPFDDDDVKVRSVESGGVAALTRGSLVHLLFEVWDMTGSPPIDEILDAEPMDPRQRQTLSQYLHETAARFRQSALAERIRREQDRVRREEPFLLRAGDAVISGVIDLMFSDGTVVDYKTGAVSSEKQGRYEGQLRLYAAAARRLSNVAVPPALIYYVDAGEVHPVDTGETNIEATMRLVERAVFILQRYEPDGGARTAAAPGKGTAGGGK